MLRRAFASVALLLATLLALVPVVAQAIVIITQGPDGRYYYIIWSQLVPQPIHTDWHIDMLTTDSPPALECDAAWADVVIPNLTTSGGHKYGELVIVYDTPRQSGDETLCRVKTAGGSTLVEWVVEVD